MRLERERDGQNASAEGSGAGAAGADDEAAGAEGSRRRAAASARSEVDDAIQELEDAEIEEQELEEVEDLLEYYLQRVATNSSEAEKLLSGARDLEESIAVSLSARRLSVIRLELMLSIGSFAAALGAVISSIFGMNLRSTFENSVVGFWGVTAGICMLCFVSCWLLFRFAKSRRIL